MTIITKERVAEILGVKPATVLTWARLGIIPSKHLTGKHVVFIEEKIMECLSKETPFINVRKTKKGASHVTL